MQTYMTKSRIQNKLEQLTDSFLQDFGVVETILRTPQQFFAELRDGIELPNKIIAMLVSSVTFFMVYGAILGSTHSPLQAISSAIKLPIVFLGASLICLPTLYVFSLLLGSNERLGQTISLILMGVTVTGVLLLSFAPITFLFMLTTSGYAFFKLLNVAFMMIAAYIGMSFLRKGRRVLEANNVEFEVDGEMLDEGAAGQVPTKASKHALFGQHLMFRGWLLLYFFVGTQLSWAMRPFVGHPAFPFRVFSDVGGNFYSDIIRSLGEVFGFWMMP